MKRVIVMTGALASVLALAGCKDKISKTTAQAAQTAPGLAGAVGGQGLEGLPKAMKTLSAGSFNPIPETACSTDPKKEPVETVTVSLGDVLGQLSAKRQVDRSIKNAQGNDVAKIDGTKLGAQWPTSLDMDVSAPPGSPPRNSDDYVLVTIKLTTKAVKNMPGVYFLRPLTGAVPDNPPPAGDDSSYAVMAPLPESADWKLCGRKKISITPTMESVSFGIKQGSGTISLNIGLLVPTKPEKVPGQPSKEKTYVWLPIFLDPNVRNEG